MDYDKGATPADEIAEEIYKMNLKNSKIIGKNTTNGNLLVSDPEFYVYNDADEKRYPSVAGEVSATVKTTFLSNIIGKIIPINCRAQATTHYIVIEDSVNKGMNVIPQDMWEE